jgi:hypothetical protein
MHAYVCIYTYTHFYLNKSESALLQLMLRKIMHMYVCIYTYTHFYLNKGELAFLQLMLGKIFGKLQIFIIIAPVGDSAECVEKLHSLHTRAFVCMYLCMYVYHPQ